MQAGRQTGSSDTSMGRYSERHGIARKRNFSGGVRHAVEAGGGGSCWENEEWSAASSAYLGQRRGRERGGEE